MSGITIERNVTSISTNASARTNPKTRGMRSFIRSPKSTVCAVWPLTSTVASTPPNALGMSSVRSDSSARCERSSLPLPAIGMSIRAAVPSALIATVERFA